MFQAETLLHLQTETAILPLEVIPKINLEVLIVKVEQTLLLKIPNALAILLATILIEVAEVVCHQEADPECLVVVVVGDHLAAAAVEDKNC